MAGEVTVAQIVARLRDAAHVCRDAGTRRTEEGNQLRDCSLRVASRIQ
jgi:hypothetical protein